MASLFTWPFVFTKFNAVPKTQDPKKSSCAERIAPSYVDPEKGIGEPLIKVVAAILLLISVFIREPIGSTASEFSAMSARLTEECRVKDDGLWFVNFISQRSS